MTETENRNQHAAAAAAAAKQQNGAAMAETSTVEDVFDDTYKEKEGPKPPRRLVWRNIVLMALLHFGALYGLVLLPSAKGLTIAWSEYELQDFFFVIAFAPPNRLLPLFFFLRAKPCSQRTKCAHSV